MKKKKILFGIISLFLLAVFAQNVFSIPPRPISTTSISEPPISGKSEKVLEIIFTINQSNLITLNSLSIKNLPQTIINPTGSDYYLTITDGSSKILFKSNILAVFNLQSNLSDQYYAIPYPNDAKYLYFYYQNAEIARYEVPQEFPILYIAIAIIAVVIVVAIYFVHKKYTIQV